MKQNTKKWLWFAAGVLAVPVAIFIFQVVQVLLIGLTLAGYI